MSLTSNTIFVADFDSSNNVSMCSIEFDRIKSTWENYFWKKISYFRTLESNDSQEWEREAGNEKILFVLKILVSTLLYFLISSLIFLKISLLFEGLFKFVQPFVTTKH